MIPSTAQRPVRPPTPAAVARAIISRKTGLCPALRTHWFRGPVPFQHVQAYPSNPLAFDRPGPSETAGGSGFALRDAWISCLFEAIERYGASVSEDHPMVWAPAEMRWPFLYGERLPWFADWQYDEPGFPYQRPRAGAELRWVQVRSLLTGRPRLFPASLAFLPLALTSAAEGLAPCTSNGLAAGTRWAEACLNGLLEVCERDAFMIAWLHRHAPPRLLPARDSELAAHLDRVARILPGSRTVLLDLTNDLGIPVALAVHQANWRGRPLVSVGAAARATLEQAALKALLEALAGYPRLVEDLSGPAADWRPRPDFRNVVEFRHHGLVYADPSIQGALDFLSANPEQRVLDRDNALASDPEAALEQAVSRLAAVGEEPMVLRLTSADLESLGVEVVRVIVPGAVPMSPDHRYPFLGPPRLYQVPVSLGWRSQRPGAADLNLSIPHPFA